MPQHHLNLEIEQIVGIQCPACKGNHLVSFYKLHGVPVDCAAVFDTFSEAIGIPQGEIKLGFCETCGFIHNIAYDPGLMVSRGSYEDQQGFSPTFMEYANHLVSHLIAKYDLRDKTVLEIGCGKGDFLNLLCQQGPNQGIGIDPLSPDGDTIMPNYRIRFIKEVFSRAHGKYQSDLLLCRHTLEHLDDPLNFLMKIRQSLNSHLTTPVFFELPDVTRILDEIAFWDVYYEHCGYFTPHALANLFGKCEFEITDLVRSYHNQHLSLHALPSIRKTALSHDYETPADIWKKVESFNVGLRNQITNWQDRLSMAIAKGKRCVIWGSGSKCIGFLASLPISEDIDIIVDINPNRTGKFIPKFGKRIVYPDYLKKYRPDIVIIMNSAYQKEIQSELSDMGLNPSLFVL